ncbi:hypothetical protein WOSG25_220020 [Weissella oryzae SG25]|uniref:Tail spike domain-containing protein n=1 Tax=Weissella oryzae (strain DSM 25784 / JCM 18191 / LMG 30913 / SG25) TaxID=1329250 RepID=A0A069CWX0_WEIOS|nr:phage tail spike protein [Weissella oryzae]GAK31974.1 hypothetical protein WOSG25_220020 [Weissella oryzae SG25]
MTPILYESSEVDFKTNGLGKLAEIQNAEITEQRNGILQLTATYPVAGRRYNDISIGRLILAKPSPKDANHAFRITNLQLDISGKNVEIQADSITYDLRNNLIKSVKIKDDNGLMAMNAIKGAMVHQSIFDFYSNIETVSSTELSYVNPLEAIAGTNGSILQYWGGEMLRENRRISMYKRRGDDDVMTFRLGKNISSMTYTIDTANLVTKIYPYVKQTVNEVDKYIEGDSVESPNMNKYFDIYIRPVDVSQDIQIEQDESEDSIKAKINEYAKNWFTKSENTDVDLPEVTIEVDVISLRESADLSDQFKELENIGLTDTVTVFVPEFNVDVTAVVNELHYDPVSEQVISLTIGTARLSYTDYNKSQFEDMQNKITVINEEANYAATKLWDTETELNFSTDGIIATDPNYPQRLVIFNSAGIGVSEDGGKTFGNAITGKGINATAITTGILKAIQIIGVTITGSTITSRDGSTQASITLNNGELTFKNRDGRDVAAIVPTTDGSSGVANGSAILQYPGEIFSINTNDPNAGMSLPLIKVPADSNVNDPYFELPGKLSGGITSRDNTLWISARNQVILSGNGGSSNALNVYGDHVDVLGNFNVYNGSKNAVHPTREGFRATPAYETAESYLGDIGEAITDGDGTIEIKIEDLFGDTINTDYAYQVFLSSYSKSHVWVSERGKTSFVVESDEPNVPFTWELKGKRRGYEGERLVDSGLTYKDAEKMYKEVQASDEDID